MKNTTRTIYIQKLNTKLAATVRDLRKRFSDKIIPIFIANLAMVIFQIIYLRLRFEYVNELAPFWYTRLWGDYQFGQKQFLYFIPIISSAITIIGTGLIVPLKRYYVRYSIAFLGYFTVIANFLLSYSLVRIILIASKPFEPLINPLYMSFIIPGLLAFLLVQFVLPRFISYAHDHDIVTNPNIHRHPSMLLAEPSARGGGFIYGILFIILAIIFVGLPSYLLAFYIAVLLIAVLGYIDDFQNTHPETKLRFMENPFIRLLLLFGIVAIVTALGTKIFSISSPFGGVFAFNSGILSIIITTIWIVWVLNVLSWSNGIDGQYAGIVGVASILLVLLALRFTPLQAEYQRVAMLAAISAGLSLGFISFTWHPSKIMWGFGAMSAGLVLSVLSILISTKVITSVIIILIPFLDAFVTVFRRLLAGKNPLKGDRSHLHHILLDRGWSVRKIAIFYWLTTAVFGTIGYVTAEKFTIQMGLFLAGVVAFVIILLNLKLKKEIIAPKNPLPDQN